MTCSLPIQAQTQYTIDDVIPGGKTYFKLAPHSLRGGVLTNQGLLHQANGNWMLIPFSGKEETYLTPEEWKTLAQEDIKGLPHLQVDASTNILIARQQDSKGHTHMWFIEPKEKQVTNHFVIKQEYQELNPCVKAQHVAVMDGKNIFMALSNGTVRQVTYDGSDNIVYGMPAARNEFGTNSGTFWSPNGRYMALYKIDQTEVESYPLVQITAPIAQATPIKYPMVGRASQKVQIGIYDTKTQYIRYLDTGTVDDHYLTNLKWSPDSHHLYIDEVSRDQKKNWLTRYDIRSGKPGSSIIKEENEKYIEPMNPICFVPTREDLLIRKSRVNGYAHLYCYSNTGRLAKQLTNGNWEVIDFYGVDPKGQWVYFSANKEDPRRKDLYRVGVRGGSIERLTTGVGTNQPVLSPNFQWVFNSFSSLNTPLIQTLGPVDKPQDRMVIKDEKVPTEGLPRVQLGTLTAADNKTTLYYKITLPNTIQEGKKYPVIVYVYGGPHAQLVQDRWGGLRQNWDNYMAQQGFIVFTLDNRGSDHRGMAFESATYHQLGKEEVADQMKGIEYLRSLPFVDTNRIGVHGWSFGGYMATRLMLDYPEVFKVGVAGGPVLDWKYYEVMYGERYMGTPQENPQGYQQGDLVARAKELQGRLLLIHGDVDPVVVWQHSLAFLKAAQQHRKLPDYMVYPGHEHNVIGTDRPQLYMYISRYFKEHL